MTTMLVVDDHDLVRIGISRLLSDIPGVDVVGTADTGEEGIRIAREKEPQIVLMDMKMPGMGGLEATKRLLQYLPDTKVIGISGSDVDLYPESFIKAGAVGFLSKGSDVAEMALAIKTVLAGKHFISPEVAQQLALKNLSGGSSPFDQLSERELTTAIMISRGEKVAAIAEHFSVSPKTVNTFRYRIFEKLDIDSDVELALLAVRYNLLELEPIQL